MDIGAFLKQGSQGNFIAAFCSLGERRADCPMQ
jgi:hypothetical protein